MRRLSAKWGMSLCLLVGGCVSTPPSSHQWTAREAALPVMEQITVKVGRCWFQSGAKDFKPYRLAPELRSFSDRPRILLVPYADPTARPLLVVEASGNPALVSAYGPLLSEMKGKRIVQDITRWLKGSAACD